MIVLVLVMCPLIVSGAEDAINVPLQEVQASEILAKIQKGEPVIYNHVIVSGDLDLDKIDLPMRYIKRTSDEMKIFDFLDRLKIIASPIKITESTFDGRVDLSYAVFKEAIDFSGSNFSKNSMFIGSVFNGYADFSGSVFNDDADFMGTVFNDVAGFEGSTFNDYAGFMGTAFMGRVCNLMKRLICL